MDQNGNMKDVGGDEFYITFHSNAYNYQNHTLAVAGNVTDNGDGSYRLGFTLSPMIIAQGQLDDIKGYDKMGGLLTIHFVYTCGIGRLAPPSKKFWTNAGFTQTKYSIRVDTPPPIQMFNPPERVVDFDQFDHTIFIGDSLMEQFTGRGEGFFLPKNQVTMQSRYRKPYSLESYMVYAGIVDKELKKVHNVFNPDGNKTLQLAVVLGSSTWDILADDVGLGALFLEHRLAMWKLFNLLHEKYPRVTFVWKSATALHAHVVIDKRNEMG